MYFMALNFKRWINKLHSHSLTKHYVSTWSPLAVSFNTKYEPKQSIGIKTGAFKIRALTSESGLQVMKENAIANTQTLLNELLHPNRSRNAVKICDDLSDGICQVADLAEFIRLMHPSGAYAEYAEDVCCAMSNLVENLNTNRDLYYALKSAVENGDVNEMTEEEKHVGKLFLFDFEQCGIHLSEEDRKKVVEYNDRILQLGQTFMNYASTPYTANINDVPEDTRRYFRVQDGRIIIGGFSDLTNEDAREFAYKGYHIRNLKQEHFLDELLLYRQKLAETCGFKTYANRAVQASTAGSTDFVINFLQCLNKELFKWCDNDVDLLKTMKKMESEKPLQMWDVAFFIHKAKLKFLHGDINDYSPYFSLGTCMDGISNLLSHLYGISFVNTPLEPGEGWTSDIYKLAVMDEAEGLLGYIYCDFFERLGRPNQDCHFTIRGGRKLSDGSYQNPIVVVTLNFPCPSNSKPCLLTPVMVENLFHEMGHAIHSMLGRANFQHVTGTRCATDFAEVPSILMEYFCYDPRVLKTFAVHYETKEPMPEKLVKKLCCSKIILNAIEMQTQIFYSALDHTYHTNKNVAGHTTDILRSVQSEYYRIPFVENTAWQLRFSHLIGYGAKYYSYLLSKTIATTIWRKYFKDDPFSRSSGEKYRRQCLAHGGAKPSQLLVKDFLQMDITPENLIPPLIDEASEMYKTSYYT